MSIQLSTYLLIGEGIRLRFVWSRCDKNDHTTLTTPLPVWPSAQQAKLPSQGFSARTRFPVLFFCSFCLSFWPLPTIRYISCTYYPPSSFLLLGLSLSNKVRFTWEKSWWSWMRCIVCLIVRLSSVIQMYMKDVKSSTCWSSFGSIFMRSDFPSQLLVCGRSKMKPSTRLLVHYLHLRCWAECNASHEGFNLLRL